MRTSFIYSRDECNYTKRVNRKWRNATSRQYQWGRYLTLICLPLTTKIALHILNDWTERTNILLHSFVISTWHVWFRLCKYLKITNLIVQFYEIFNYAKEWCTNNLFSEFEKNIGKFIKFLNGNAHRLQNKIRDIAFDNIFIVFTVCYTISLTYKVWIYTLNSY